MLFVVLTVSVVDISGEGSHSAPVPRSPALNAAFGEHLRRLRGQARMSQDTLGRRAGLSRTSITNIEVGRQHVSLDVLYRLADALGQEPRDLLPTRDRVHEHGAPEMADLEGLPQWDQQFVRAAVKKLG